MTMADTTVTKTVTVEAPIERCFETFTSGFDSWWPRSHHIGAAEMKTAVLEGRPGGRWYEIGEDGSECEWGRVLVWDPPQRLVLAWQINGSWQFDPGFETELEILFSAEGPARTQVRLEHRNLERFGADREQIQESLGSDGGWNGLLKMFAEAAEAAV